MEFLFLGAGGGGSLLMIFAHISTELYLLTDFKESYIFLETTSLLVI